MPQDRELIEFFGRPAFMPLGPARLAVMTGAATFVGGCCYTPDRGYVLQYTGPLEFACTGDRNQDILAAARGIAAVVENYIRARPEQWMMFHPVWPEP
jgi:KDO2-lipid IV(A) lauroyltransferase